MKVFVSNLKKLLALALIFLFFFFLCRLMPQGLLKEVFLEKST